MDRSATTTPPGLHAGPQELGEWLAALARRAGSCVLLGGTGHLELTPDEEAQAARDLERTVLPQFAALPTDAEVLVLTGLAPGADLLFAETALAWLTGRARRCRHVGLLPVPAEVLWGDWVTRAGAAHPARIAAVRARFDAVLRACTDTVYLWDRRAPIDWSDLALRQRQYRRLGAVLAEQCDVLVAVLRPDRSQGRPGGTAEVVAWREDRHAIPVELSAGPRRHRSAWRQGDRLIVVNPADAPPGLQRAREALREGNYLLSYDLAVNSAREGSGSDEHEYVTLQALANAGSTEAALRRFAELPLALRERDEDWLALAGRLHKDLGLRGGAAAPRHFLRAAACYRTAFERTGGSFSAINAATTLLLGGDADAARALAHEVLARLEHAPAPDDRARYYLGATEAEAALLLGDTGRLRAALARIDALLPDDINARSRTRRQLRRICEALAVPAEVLAPLTLPPVVYVGPGETANVPPRAFAYAGITEPSELIAAERAAAAGARLHVVLAAPRDKMLAHWQWAHGTGWTHRLEPFLEQARETSVALGFLESEDRWCDAYVRAMALGLSRLAARRLDCEWRAVGVDDTATAELLAHAPAAPIAIAGVAFARRFAAVIFADFAGFSRLPDRQLPAFWAQFMRAIGQRLARFDDAILLRRTWGDALHLVCASTRVAAEAACEIQACLEELRPALPDALAVLELRLAAHYAPVFSGHDPIEGAATFFGTQLSLTARIEPVTPPGMIFVTEAFAAQLALEAPAAFLLEYAGEVQLAKAYAHSRLFSLRAAVA